MNSRAVCVNFVSEEKGQINMLPMLCSCLLQFQLWGWLAGTQFVFMSRV